jgi:hypothetical protein
MQKTYTIGKHKLTLRPKVTPEHLALVKRMMGIESMKQFISDVTTMANAQAFIMDVQFNQEQFSELMKVLTGTEEEILLSDIDDSEVIGSMLTDFFARYGLRLSGQ